MKKMFCAVDFSEVGEAANEVAAQMAKCAGAALTFLHVTPPAAVGGAVGAPVAGVAPAATGFTPEGVDRLARASRGKLDTLAARHAVESDSLVRFGEVATTITSTAAELGVEHLVLGTHGRSGVSRLLLGSTAESVIRDAPCPVTVVKPQENDS